MEKEIICGIYKIENILNGKKYVGLSNNIYRRWKDHIRRMNGGYHENKHLQRSWNKYSQDNFVFEILEKCNELDLAEKEIYYIDLLKSNNSNFGYNCTTGGDRPKINKEILEKKSLEHSKRVLQFSQDGEFIKEHINAIFAAKELGTHNSLIYQCCLGKLCLGVKYQWRFKKDFDQILSQDVKVEDLKIKPFVRECNGKKVCQIDMNGNLIKVWDSCAHIGDKLNVAYENIRSCCDKCYGRKTYIGYIWLYKTDYDQSGVDLEYHMPKGRNKEVLQYDKQMNHIKTFISAREAMLETGVNYRQISKVCNGTRKTAGGYIWRFPQKP